MAEQMAVLQQLLLATLDPRPSVRQAAEQQLTAARQTDLGQFVGSMAALIALDQPLPGPQGAPGSPEDLLIAKQIAAVAFKNSISAKDMTLDGAAAQAWRALPNATKADIKKQLLAALRTDCIQVGNAVCQVLAKLGVIELRSHEFEDLLPALQDMVQQAVACQQQQQEQQQQLMKACGRHALTCLAYLCEELADIVAEGEDPSEVLSQQRCNVVLTAVAHGLKDPDPQLKVAALRALYHALIFAKENFAKTEERDYIISSVLEAGNAANPSAVQVAALECIVQISQEYYSFLGAYMPAVGSVTWNALKSSDSAVVIAALEVWNALAEEELAIIEGESTRWTLLNIMKEATPFLLPLLLEQLLNAAEDEDDDDSWTPAMAAAICLGLCAQVVKDAILPLVINFVQLNFGSTEWRRREASVLALGCVMEGPSAEAMAPYVARSFPILVEAVASDASVAVRDSAAWTLGKTAQQHAPIVLRHLFPPADVSSTTSPNNNGGALLLAIVERLTDQPRVAVHICWMLHELADNINTPEGRAAYQGEAATQQQDQTPLDPIFPKLCEALLSVSERPDADDKNLREAAFNCMGALIKNAGSACWNHLLLLLDHFEGQLRKSFSFEQTEQTKQRQGMLCGVIQILCLRLGDQVKPVAGKLWNTLKQVFQRPTHGLQVSQGESSAAPNNVHGFIVSSEPSVCDALLALSALINASGPAVSPFAGEVADLLVLQMQHQHEPQEAAASAVAATASTPTNDSSSADELQAARICIELVGDLSRALGTEFGSLSDALLHEFYQLLRAPSVDRSLKPVVIVAVGDVALSLGGAKFAPFTPWLIELLVQAGVTPYDAGPPNWQLNEEWIWYVHELRSATLEALASCVYALKEAQLQEVLRKEVNGMLQVVKAVAEAPTWVHGSAQMVQQALELTGDLLSTFGRTLGGHLSTASFVLQLQREAERLATEEGNAAVGAKAQWLAQRIATIRGCRECADLLDGTQSSLKHQHFKSDVLLLGEMLSGA
ncbi:importin subunit beta-1, putative [Eimeria tenella]|uniref:Importin subunit beta-1, putative n=1 Tax=Eimeria tenella TaxID=5802 RepID=U6KXE3_EIMTE|nr:importin subunit beta-1, putative [Eimeria tenella]CDJ42636.1 importin subunit beta-1, putative [Eimeria tenella]|eukprot:XP_013233386.1 importin subunit beta-1, putative [Eimeria tenella]